VQFVSTSVDEYASGAWHCPVVPPAWTLKEHGGLFTTHGLGLCSVSESTYTAATGQLALLKDYATANIEFATPREMAEELVRMRPEIAYAGWGPDLIRYVKWFRTALKQLRLHGLYYSFADRVPPRDSVYTLLSTVESIELPPRGLSTEAEWSKFAEQHRVPLV